jgi:hypothetical protein
LTRSVFNLTRDPHPLVPPARAGVPRTAGAGSLRKEHPTLRMTLTLLVFSLIFLVFFVSFVVKVFPLTSKIIHDSG